MTVKVNIVFKKDEINPMDDVTLDMEVTEYANLISAMRGSKDWFTIKTPEKEITFQPSSDIKRIELVK